MTVPAASSPSRLYCPCSSPSPSSGRGQKATTPATGAFVARKNRWLLALESQEGRLRLAVIWKWPFDEPFRSEHTAYTDRMYLEVQQQFSKARSPTMRGSSKNTATARAGTISTIQTSPTYFLPVQFIVFRYRGIFALL